MSFIFLNVFYTTRAKHDAISFDCLLISGQFVEVQLKNALKDQCERMPKLEKAFE